jgi:hypothetical protein
VSNMTSTSDHRTPLGRVTVTQEAAGSSAVAYRLMGRRIRDQDARRSKAVVCYATTLDLSGKLRRQSLQVLVTRDCISNIFTVVLASQQMPADKGS